MSDAVIIAMLTGVFSTLAIILNNWSNNKKNNASSNYVELKYHPFFARSESLKRHIERTFIMENKGKEAIFKDIIKNHLCAFQKILLQLASEIDDKKINDSTHLYNKHLEVLEAIIELHHSYYKCNPCYSIEEQQALDIVIKKYDMWHKSKRTFLEDTIMNICNSPFYGTEAIKGAVILDLYLSIAIDTINDASKTLSRINGDLKGLTFKGIVI